MASEGQWLSILDYSRLRNISVSTVRRNIKGNRVKYKKVDGKYLIFVSAERLNACSNHDQEFLDLKLKIEQLELELRNVHEENADLKTLILFYESKFNKIESSRNINQVPDYLPELPVS
ncbi:MAG: hypothetical protein H6622_03455 [Halobacteriovoraceae bacterium]|nr:hypothetical protein [Halobacteriovoraceae bacterium]